MTEALALEPIERTADTAPTLTLTPAAAASRAVMTVREATLARFSPAEIHVTDMADRYKGAKWDTSTPKGLAAAKAARLEMREQGRFLVQRLVEETKSVLNDMKADVATEGERLIAILKPAEDAAHAAIEAQKAIDEEAAEKKKKAAADAAARVAKFNADIEVIAAYPTKAEGKPSANIAAGIKYVQGLDVSAEKWFEFTPRATAAKDEALKALEALHLKALADELAAQQQAEALAAAQRQQALVDELGELAALPATAKAANTLEALTGAVDRAQAWDMDPTRWGVMHMAAVGTRTGVLTDLAAKLQAYSAAVAALAATPEPDPAVAAAALAAFAEPEEFAPEPEPVTAPVAAPATVVFVQSNAAGEVSEPVAINPAPAEPDPSSEPTLSASAICERFGDGLSMTRAFIENVLRVPADGLSPKKHPQWSERSARAIALALAARANTIAGEAC